MMDPLKPEQITVIRNSHEQCPFDLARFDPLPGIGQGEEPRGVQALLKESAVKGLGGDTPSNLWELPKKDRRPSNPCVAAKLKFFFTQDF